MAETKDAIRDALAEPGKKKAGKKKGTRKKGPPTPEFPGLKELFQEGIDTAEKIADLLEDRERLEFMMERWLSVATRGHSEHQTYCITRGTTNISSKDYDDPRKAIDDIIRTEKR